MDGDSSTEYDHIAYETLTELEPLKEGGYGLVHTAKHAKLGKVVFKQIVTKYIDDKVCGQLFKEAEIQRSLDHPNILKILGIVFESKHYGIVLKYAENGEMNEFFERNNFTWKEKLPMIRGVVAGMIYLHSLNPPIIHGDLKIQNVLISADRTAQVADFGFSRWKDYSQSMSEDKVRLGTLTHIPPEIWNNRYHRKNEKFDVYGFGILLWEAMSQKKPFERESNVVITVYVSKGHRPDLDLIPADVSKTSIELMKNCWSQDLNIRPSFPDIMKQLDKQENGKEVSTVLIHMNTNGKSHMVCQKEEIEEIKEKKEFTNNRHTSQVEPINIDKPVSGLAWCNNTIYVVCSGFNQIYAYRSQKPFNRLQNCDIEIDMMHPQDLTACPSNLALFISDCDKNMNCLWKIQVTDKLITQFPIYGRPSTLSVNSAGELLVLVETKQDKWRLDVYNSSDVSLAKQISLPLEFKKPEHAVQISNGNFIIAYRVLEKKYLVSEMTFEGMILRSYAISSIDSETIKWRYHLAVDEHDNIFIADYHNDKLISLDCKLNETKVHDNQKFPIDYPQKICYLQENKQLIVGQGSGPQLWFSSSPKISFFILSLCD